MSSRQATKFHMSNLRKRAEKVVTAAKEIIGIKSKHMYVAKIEQTVYLQSIGRSPDSYLSSSSSEYENSEDEDDAILGEEDNVSPLDIPQRDSDNFSLDLKDPEEANKGLLLENDDQEHPSSITQARSEGPPSRSSRGEKDLPHLDVNSVLILDILREVEWN